MSMDFDKLYNTYYMEIYSYVMTIMKNRHMAEEITQEVFFKAIKSESKFKGESSEFTWLCAIAKHLCMDELRKKSKWQVLSEELPQESTVEQLLEDDEMTLRIHQILHGMEEPYKEVFQLRIFGELTFEKIGKIFGRTENWARVTYHRARLKIQERMEKDER